jgi:N-acetylglucosaminyldiphosphoundecaprenol N-acetyl-beta-D-mannosaminyltransferase
MRSGVRILGIHVDDVTYERSMQAIERYVQSGQPHQIVTVNTEYLVAAWRDPEFAQVLRCSSLNLPDSVGVLWAARWLGHPLPERVTGSDGLYHIARLCARQGYRLYLLGAAPGVADRAAERLVESNPGLTVCGTYSGSPAPEQEDAISRRIREARADVLLVAFGGARQEKWISRNLKQTCAAVGVGVGGAFDFCAGVQQRAPLWMQRAGLEWFYRLLRQPWRWKRMLALPYLVWLVFRQKMGSLPNQETRRKHA